MVPKPCNRLLASLPEPVRQSLLAHMEPVDLPLRTSLFVPEEQPRYVHFMLTGMASIVTAMESGDGVEVGLVGNEGFPERTQVLGPQFGNTRCFVQVEGTALRLSFAHFRQVFTRQPELLTGVHRFVQHEALTSAQLAACNRVHEVEARLARWLLMAQDRVGRQELRLTQEFLGEMLGARRSSVNIAAGALQRAGMIDYSRGRIVLADRGALEGIACECYPILRSLLQNLYL